MKKEDILDPKNRVIKTNIGREFLVFNANNYDKTKKYKRGPQVITPKDLGYILARSGVDKHSKILEAGGGSGATTCFFANFVSKVRTYEIKPEHTKIIEKNLIHMGLDKEVELFIDDLVNHIETEKDLDMLFLDIPEPVKILEKDLTCVKNGKYIICYVPSITQIQEITKLVGQREDLYLEEISEVILRHWRVWERVARPEHRKEIDHTAFLIFIRKL